MLVPAGRSNSIFHDDRPVSPPLIVYLPSQPLPQSELLTKVAEGPAACAVAAMPTSAAPATSTPATRSVSRGVSASLMSAPGWWVRRDARECGVGEQPIRQPA